MPGPPRDSTALHLFRALLRECSYLPDPLAQEYFKKHTITRFRRHWASEPSLSRERQNQLLKTGRKGLSFLSRANNGRSKELYQILSYAYGRSGRRRRDLIDELQAPQAPIDTTVQTNETLKPGVSNAKTPRLTAQAEAIAISQFRSKISRDHKGEIKSPRPKIPKENAWLRPMPLVRVKNLTADWYAKTLDRLFPPLPEKDHRRLRGLASGELPWTAPTFRSSSTKLDISGVADEKETVARKVSRTQTISRRKMARLWSKVLAQCPMLTWNESGKKARWRVAWGSTKQNCTSIPTTNRAMHLFEGVDERGNIVPLNYSSENKQTSRKKLD